MSTATNEVLDMAHAKDTDLRTAAYALALTKLNDFYEVRGIDIWMVSNLHMNHLKVWFKLTSER